MLEQWEEVRVTKKDNPKQKIDDESKCMRNVCRMHKPSLFKLVLDRRLARTHISKFFGTLQFFRNDPFLLAPPPGNRYIYRAAFRCGDRLLDPAWESQVQ